MTRCLEVFRAPNYERSPFTPGIIPRRKMETASHCLRRSSHLYFRFTSSSTLIVRSFKSDLSSRANYPRWVLANSRQTPSESSSLAPPGTMTCSWDNWMMIIDPSPSIAPYCHPCSLARHRSQLMSQKPLSSGVSFSRPNSEASSAYSSSAARDSCPCPKWKHQGLRF